MHYAYPLALLVISLGVAVAEMLWPWRKEQERLRAFLCSDVLHLVFNGHFLGLILFGLFTRFLGPYAERLESSAGGSSLFFNAAADWPLWIQIPVALIAIDFVQWGVHNLLHRVPFLWPFHKTHHSIVDGEMDWICSFRFQWTEVVVYKSILYFPLAFFGFSSEAVFVHAVFGTLIGHLNHANLNLDYGPLKYVLNNPKMHIWHHDYDGDMKTTVNFGIIFSTWDFIFGTAKISDAPPAHLGFKGVETFPRDFFRQMAWPIHLPGLVGKTLTAFAGIAIIVGAYALQRPRAPSTPMLGEVAASSQPAARRLGFDYPANAAEATRAVSTFGNAARAAGYVHPEAMVSVDELASAMGAPNLVVVDVRPAERFMSGHIPAAVQTDRGGYSETNGVPGRSKSAAALAALMRSLGVMATSTVVLYGDGGPEPYRLWWTLRDAGVLDARVLDGGLAAWKNAGHGVAEGAGHAATPGNLVPLRLTTTTPLWADLEPFRARSPQRVDTRSEIEFTGAEKHPKAARAGRVPGAQHLDWVRIHDDTHRTLLKPPALKALFADTGVALDRPILTLCQSGTRSAAVYFALYEIGVPPEQMRNYDGSWAEYSRLTELPVETGPPQ